MNLTVVPLNGSLLFGCYFRVTCMSHVKLTVALKTEAYHTADTSAIYTYNVHILQRGLPLTSVVQLVSVKDAPGGTKINILKRFCRVIGHSFDED